MVAFSVSVEGALDTYSKLTAAVTEETDGRIATASDLARFVRNAESEIKRFLSSNPVRPMRTRTPIGPSSEYTSLPSGCVRPIAIELIDGTGCKRRVPYVTQEKLSQVQCEPVGDGFPRYFTQEGNDIRLWPAPTSAKSGTLFYYEALPALTSTNEYNWLLENHPDVYFEGALFQAYKFMPDAEMATQHYQLFRSLLEAIPDSYPEPANEATVSPDPNLALIGVQRWLR